MLSSNKKIKKINLYFKTFKKGSTKISIELNYKLMAYTLTLTFFILYYFDISSYLFNVQNLTLVSLGIVWLLFLSSYKTGHVLSYRLSRKAVSKAMTYLLILTFFVFYQFYFLNFNLIIIAASPTVNATLTYNTSNVQVSTFIIENKVIVRANATDSAPATHPVSNTTLNISNPSSQYNVYQKNMTQVGTIGTSGYVFEWNYTLNSTDVSGTYKVNVTAKDTVGSTAKNSTTFTVTAGLLVVNLTTPSTASTTNFYQYNVFNVNATVTCRNGNCGNVYGTVRYNASSANPDTAISTTTGAVPLYVSEALIRPYSWDEVNNSGTLTNPTYAYDDGLNDSSTNTDIDVTDNTGTPKEESVEYVWGSIEANATLFYTWAFAKINDGTCSIKFWNWATNQWNTFVETGSQSQSVRTLSINSTYVNSTGGFKALFLANAVQSGLSSSAMIDLYDVHVAVNHNLTLTPNISMIYCGFLSVGQSCQLNWIINATGSIDSAYKIGVLFNSSYTSVTQNNTNNATIQIIGGNLEVNLTDPPIGTTNVNQNTTFNVNATVTCRIGNCGPVYGAVRYNVSSANPDVAINTTRHATPLYITSLKTTPVSACKPLANQSEPRVGFCMIPTWSYYSNNYTVHKMCIDFISNDSRLDGDFTGGTGNYATYPDGGVDVVDVSGVSNRIDSQCGNSDYEQMADRNNDCVINQTDLNMVNRNYGNNYNYILNVTGVYVAFSTGVNSTLDSDNCTWVPTNARNFTVYNSTNNKVGAMILFYAPKNPDSCGSLSKDQSCQLNWTVNATGSIDSVYKIGVLFNSSYTTVTQNHTNNATIQILGGRLEVNLTNPPIGTTNVVQNTTFNVNATVTCRDTSCGNVYGTVRYNASSANPDTTINTTIGATPLYITSLNAAPVSACKPLANQSEPRAGVCMIPTWSYTPQKLCIDFVSNDSRLDGDVTDGTGSYSPYPNGQVRASDINGVSTRNGKSCGDSGYEQMYDVDNNCTIDSYDTNIAARNFGNGGDYVYNLTGVYVAFNTGVNGTLDINNCTSIPNNAVNFTVYNSTNNKVGAMILFYAPLSILSCGSLSKDQSCQLNWTVNATGNPVAEYKVGVLFNSSYTTVTQNHTNNATITIIECTESMNIGWSSLDFTNSNPNTPASSNNATGNDNKLYNITNTGTCTLRVWIKGTDLENTTLPYPNKIGVGNLSWSNISSVYASANPRALTASYFLVNSSLTQTIKNITTYYWLAVPPVYAGRYNGTLYICENTTQNSGVSNTCT